MPLSLGSSRCEKRRLVRYYKAEEIMKKKLIALDMDGTLLYDWATLHKNTQNYLLSLQAKGHMIVIATGRPFRSSDPFYDLLELKTPIINFNGGIITSKNDPQFKRVEVYIDKAPMIDIYQANKAIFHNAFYERIDDIYLHEDHEWLYPFLHLNDLAKLVVGPIDETLPDEVNGGIVIAKHGNGPLIEQYIKSKWSNVVDSRNWDEHGEFDILELYTPKTNKGLALEYVANYLGFAKEDIIAFGDGINDFELLEFAGTGIAVANAHPELKKKADIVSPKNHQQFPIEYHLNQLLDL
jgi:Cof subfamily protein (haloacid dehalogenase superfamily)